MTCSCCRQPLTVIVADREVFFKGQKLLIKDSEYYECNCLGKFQSGAQAAELDRKVKEALVAIDTHH